jgi:hypothetical protein
MKAVPCSPFLSIIFGLLGLPKAQENRYRMFTLPESSGFYCDRSKWL